MTGNPTSCVIYCELAFYSVNVSSQSIFIAVSCGGLPDPDNGAVDTSSGTTFMNTATYTCNEGYMLTGTMTRMCGSDMMWIGDAPTCQREILYLCF